MSRATIARKFLHTLRPMLRKLRRVRIIVDMVAVVVLLEQWRGGSYCPCRRC